MADEKAETAGGKLKTILECLALVLTIVGTVVGFWTAGRGGAQNDAAETSQPVAVEADSTAPAPSRPLARVPVTTVSASSSAPAAVDPGFVADALSDAATDTERADRLRDVLAEYPANVMTAAVADTQYDAAASAVRVRVAVSLDAVGYAAVCDAIAATLGEPSGVFPATVTGQQKAAAFDLGPGADALLSPVRDAERRRGAEVTPEAVVLVRAAADAPRDGQELAAAGWPLSPVTAAPFSEALDRGVAASVRVTLRDAGGAAVATVTRPIATPEDGTWDSGRFVQPLMPAGHEWSLAKGRLAPEPSAREWHRDDAGGRSVLAMLPGLMSPPERSPRDRLSSERPLLRTVTYVFDLPLSADAAASVTAADAAVVSR